MVDLESPVSLAGISLDYGGKPKEIQRDPKQEQEVGTGRTKKLHTERPSG